MVYLSKMVIFYGKLLSNQMAHGIPPPSTSYGHRRLWGSHPPIGFGSFGALKSGRWTVPRYFAKTSLFFGSSIGAKRGTAHFGVVLGIYFVHECVGIILYIYILYECIYVCGGLRRYVVVCMCVINVMRCIYCIVMSCHATLQDSTRQRRCVRKRCFVIPIPTDSLTEFFNFVFF